ncbi:MAG: hypothetical protein ACRYFS_02675 [Janthinobacterium lividum]
MFKSDTVTGWDAEDLEQAALFHPRHDFWGHHFRFDSEAGVILVLTAAGRVTVTRLKMNSPRQVRARLQWVQLGLYP